MNSRLSSVGIVCLLVFGGFAGIMNFGIGNTRADMWFIEIVSGSGGFWGGETSIAVNSSGYPHISYYDASASDLKYAKWTGSAWNIQTVDSAGSVGTDTSIALDSNEYPHISYWDSTNDRLKHANWTGSTWNKDIVDTTTLAVRGTSIAIDGFDYPHISYYDPNTHELKYAKWTGSTWSTEIVDDGNNWEAGLGCSIALDISGKPCISYKYDDSDFIFLRYAKWTGSMWNINNVCQIGPHTSWGDLVSTSIAIDVNNRPHISYNDNINDDLEYARWTGGSWSFDVIDTVGDVGEYNSLALNGSDYAHISYYDSTNGDLKFARWNGSNWNIETVDSAGDVGEDTSTAIDSGGNVHISYKDSTNYYIKYAKWTPQDRPTSFVDLLPAFETTTVFGVNATAVDPDVGDTIAQVELYYKKDIGSWNLYGSDTTIPFSWNFDSSATGGDGIYQFYSRAQDNNGYWEDPSELPPSSGNNDTWTIVDTTEPTSNIDTLAAYETTVNFAVSATATDLNGISQVEIYYKKDSGSWVLYGTDTTSPFSWNFDSSATGGDGVYQFYSRGQDIGGLWEDLSQLPPLSGNNDTWTIVDTMTPISNVNALPTYKTSAVFTINITTSDSSGIAQVELYYKKDSGSWVLYGTDTNSPFSWDFDSSNVGGDGVYQFYSRAQDNGGLWEASSELPPSSGNNDTWTLVDTTNPLSNANSLPNYETSLTFQVSASASDLNGIAQVELYYKKDTGSWQLYGTDTTSPYSWNFEASGTGGDGVYQFYSKAQDNIGLWENPSELPPSSGNNDTWTIVDTTTPTSFVDPLSNYENISTFVVDAQALDQNGITQIELYYKKNSGSWQLYGSDSTSPFSWNFDSASSGGDGLYQFYSRAQDKSSLWEDPSELPPSSGNNDTWTLVDTTTPISDVNSLPNYETTTSFSVDITASDQNGIAQVELYYKKNSGSWQLYGTDITSPYSWNFDTSGTGGDGIYQFYSRAQDNCGLWEDPSDLPPSSGNNDTWTIVDTTNPFSNVNTLPNYEISLTFQISSTASDLNGIAQVELYYKKDTGSWQLYGIDTTSPFSWNFDTSGLGGEGVYQFYSRAQDNQSIWEDPSELPPSSGNNDTWTIVDITTPTSFVDSLPIFETTELFVIDATPYDLNGIAQVELYYKMDVGSWQLYGTDSTPPFFWDFDISNTGGDGLYQFYSRALDKAGLWEDPSELPPSSGNNDTWTIVDTINPTSYVNVLTTPIINVAFEIWATASDLNGIVQVRLYYKKDSGSWQLYGTDTTSPFSWIFDTSSTGGDGVYQFYSRAQDNGGLWEASSELPPSSGNNDTWTIVDTTKPDISNLVVNPSEQEIDGYVNISADVTDNNTLSEVWINITYPGGSWINVTMNKTSGVVYYYNESYDSKGTYQFTIWANDTGNYWAFTSNTFIIQDTSPPIITNLQPPSESTTNEITPTISASYSDLSGIDISSVLVKVDNVDVTVDASVLVGGVTYTPGTALSEGLHTIYLEVRDASENSNLASVTWSFTVDIASVDTIPPSISNLQPPDESTTNEITPIISASYGDPSGIDISSVLLKVDNADVTIDATVLASGVTYMPSTALSEGLHTISLEVRDASENNNLASVTWSFTIDTTMLDTVPPMVIDHQPQDTSTISHNKPTIGANYSDVSGIDISSIALELDDEDVTSSATVTESGITYVPSIPISDGIHTATLQVEDMLGNHATISWSFTVNTTIQDTTPPTADPGTDKEVSQGATVTLDGSGSNDNSGTIANFTWIFIINGEEITLYGINPSFKFENIGNYEITLSVKDPSNNSASESMWVNVIGIDSDNDGLTDYDEINIYGTDQNDPDTDNDGVKDGNEIVRGTNPLVAEPKDEDFLNEYWLILLIIILIISIIALVLLVGRKKRKRAEPKLPAQRIEQPVIRPVQPSKTPQKHPKKPRSKLPPPPPPPPPSKTSRQPLSPPPPPPP